MSLNKNNLILVSPPESPDLRSKKRTIWIIFILGAILSLAPIFYLVAKSSNPVIYMDRVLSTSQEIQTSATGTIVDWREYNGVYNDIVQCKSLNKGGWLQDFLDEFILICTGVAIAFFEMLFVACLVTAQQHILGLPHSVILTVPICSVLLGVTGVLALGGNLWHAHHTNGRNSLFDCS